jgi:HEAT repeat protein
MIAKSGKKEVLSDILNAFQSEDKPVRMAAISAAAELGARQVRNRGCCSIFTGFFKQ